MKYIVSFLILFLVSSCGSNLPFGSDFNDPTMSDITKIYNTKDKSLDLSGVGLSREVNLNLLLSDEIAQEIEKIDLSNNAIDSIILGDLPNVTYLNLSDNDLNDKDLKNLAKIKTSQTYLDLSGNGLSTEFLKTIQDEMKQQHPDIK